MAQRNSSNIAAPYFSFFHLFFCVLLSLGLLQCGGGGVEPNLQPNSLGSVPSHWAKYLSQGSIGASLDVFDGNSQLVAHQELNVDMNAGAVSSPDFKLPIGDTYRFVVVFNFGQGANDPIPFAYADFTWLVDEFSEAVQFNENDIRYGQNFSDPSIVADLSDGKIPDLDLDKDGWSNWEELHDKVNPRDPNSVPILPSVQILAQQQGTTNDAIITIIAKDNAHVEDIRLTDPLCGTAVLSDTLTQNVDGSVTRTLVVKLDLLSVHNNPRLLQALVDDGVTPSQGANSSLNFAWNGTGSRPYFVFTDPTENSEIEGAVAFKGIACSREELNLNSIRFINQEVSQYHWTANFNAQRGDYDLNSDSVDTTFLPDGVVSLKVTLQDQLNRIGSGQANFTVVNDSAIKVVSPIGRRWVFGNDSIAVTVKNVSDSNLVLVEGSGNFSLTSSTAGGAVGTLHVGNLPEGTVIPLTFKAVRSNGAEIIRKVDFTVRNKPQIALYTPKAADVFLGWNTYMNYNIVNVDPNQLSIAGQSTADQGTRNCHEDSQMPGITDCEGQFPVIVGNGNTFPLSALRLPTDPSENCGNCSISQDRSVTASQSLPNDLPKINVAVGALDDEAEAPEKVQVPGTPNGAYYHLSLKNLRSNSIDFDNEVPAGGVFNLGELDARTDFEATLDVLNGPGGNVTGEMFKDVTTGDVGLVGWWRFEDDFPGEDISGRNNHGIISGSKRIDGDSETGSLLFEKFGDHMDAPMNGFSSNEGTLMLWFKPSFDPLNPINNGANSSIAALLTSGNWTTNSIRLLYSFDAAYCPDSSYRKAICFETHGAFPAGGPPPLEPVAGVGFIKSPSTMEWNFVSASWSQITHEVKIYSNLNNAEIALPLNFVFDFLPKTLKFGYSGVSSDIWPAWAFWYKGEMQNVRGYNRALTLEVIKRICNMDHAGTCVP